MPSRLQSLCCFLVINAFEASGLQLEKRTKSSITQNIHVVYQLGCSPYALHGALALDWSWKHVEHPGRITRIVCGCAPGKEEDKMKESPLTGDPRFTVFFSKDWNKEVPKMFSEVKDDHYHAYNHPFGFADWLNSQGDRLEEEFVAYVEPDMVFTRPFLHHVVDGTLPRVERGRPVAQYYNNLAYCPEPCVGGDPGWAEFAIPEVCGANCPSEISITEPENQQAFAVGPPAIMHRDDWRRHATLWGNFSVGIRAHGHMKSSGQTWLKQGQPVYIAEMLSYSLASWALGLPHQVAKDINADLYDPCQFDGDKKIGYGCQRPSIIHYCFGNNVETPFGHWIWNKYRMPSAYGAQGEAQWTAALFSDCDMPLLEEPPNVDASAGDAAWARFGLSAEETRKRKHSLWMTQEIIAAYNGGTKDVKDARCVGGTNEQRKILRVDEGTFYVPAESFDNSVAGANSRWQVRTRLQGGSR